MTDPSYPAPPRQTVDDLDPESATPDRRVTMVRSHRTGEEYPTAEVLLGNLPEVLRALGDHVLTRSSDRPGCGLPARLPHRRYRGMS